MFNVKFSNGGGKIGVEIKINDIPWNTAWWLLGIGNCAFRESEIIDNETGEIIYNRYMSDGYFKPEKTEAEVIERFHKFITKE